MASEAPGFPPFQEHWSWGHLITGHPRFLVVKRHRLRNWRQDDERLRKSEPG